MPARKISYTLSNKGTGDLIWVNDYLEHGEWTEGMLPSQSTGRVKPGEKKTFASESGGDIPIIGSIGTGTEGWVLFSGLISQSSEPYKPVWIKIWWDIPFIPSSDSPAGVEVYLYNPLESVSATEFDDRDKTKPKLHYSMGISGYGQPYEFEDVFTNVFILPPILATALAAPTEVFINITFHNLVSVGDDNSTQGFGSVQPTQLTPVPLQNSELERWNGTWKGENVSAFVSSVPSGKLSIKLSKPSRFTKNENVITEEAQITRGWLLLDPQTATGISGGASPNNVQSPSTESPGKYAFQKFHKHLSVKTQDQHKSPDQGRTRVERVERAEIRGDFVLLSGDQTLEIYDLLDKGKEIGTALRFRQPSFSAAPTMDRFDEMLYLVPRIR